MANRFRPLLSSLIGPEQVGFMPNREARDNEIKALLLTHGTHSRAFKGLLLSTEKAFDRVAWDYVCQVRACGTRSSYDGMDNSLV